MNTNAFALDFNWTESRETYMTTIESFLRNEWFAHCNPKKLKRALEVLPIVLDECESGNVNPYLVSSMISLESTWDSNARGKLGEIGLMQTNNISVNGPAEQIRAGIRILKKGFDQCHSIIGAIAFYGTGHTCKPYRGANLRIILAERIESYKSEKPEKKQ
jgi:hypothetical protein